MLVRLQSADRPDSIPQAPIERTPGLAPELWARLVQFIENISYRSSVSGLLAEYRSATPDRSDPQKDHAGSRSCGPFAGLPWAPL